MHFYFEVNASENGRMGKELRVKNRKCLLVFCAMLLTLFLAPIHAYAHIPCMCNNPPDKCTCFIQLGDKGLAVERIIEKLQEQGYVNSVKKKEFTLEIQKAVIQFQSDHNLECTGWMDDETLNALLANVLPNESSKHSEHYWDGIYYVPTDGGIRFHSDPYCSGMLHPRMISGVNAESLGLKHCGWNSCVKCSLLTYSSLGLTPRDLPEEYYAEEEYGANTASVRTLSSDAESEYIGNKKSHIFHYNTCKSAADMSEKNKVQLVSREEAIEKGYRPCNRCNP